MAAKRKNFVKQGRGNKPSECRELTTEEEEKLFESGEFGCHNPEALHCTLWWFFSLHFGFRARDLDENRKLCWGELVLQNDPETGKLVLVWMAERGSKTRKGMEGAHQRQFHPKIFATGTERYPVRLFKRENPNGWLLSPLGKNQIGKFLPKAAQKAGLQACGKKIANHSVRKTSISRLLDGETPEIFVAQLSGHKNLQSLSSYKSASIRHQRKMSDILQQASRPGLSLNAPNFVSVDGTSSQQSSFAQQRSLSFQAMPHPSLFASANIGSISNCL